ncbi:MAG TPA: Gfo/Idh/MocA family oxidoreductase [Chthonomonadales bacterium]|nr:Gfo/Idh/MocA family oxidoreductase [Chthonomonadales bacterium]
MDRVRIGMIGVGQIGKAHLDNYAHIPGAEIVAAADVDCAEVRAVAERYGIPYATTDFRQLLARTDIDAVDVCLHNNLHAPVTIAALESGKNVYCEKPMAGSYVDAKAMLDAARACGRKLSIQLSTLFAKETKVARRLIADGRLGKLYHARSTGFRRRGRPFVDGYGTASFVKKEVAAGGALYDMGVYHISRILFLLGMPEVQRISGKVYQETGMDERRRAESGYNVEELGLGFVKCEGDLTIDIIESWAIHLGGFDGSCIVGSRGGIRFEPLSYHSSECDLEMNATFDIESADWRWHQLNDLEWAFDSPQHHWIAAQLGKVDLLPTAEVALATMLVSEGIYLSDRLGREVSAGEVLEHSASTAVAL